MYVFKKTKSPQNPYDLGDVKITTHDDEIVLPKLFQQFVSFAQACGFIINPGTAFVVDGNGCYVDNNWNAEETPDDEDAEPNASAEDFYRQFGFDQPKKSSEDENGLLGILPPPSDFGQHYYWADTDKADTIPVKSVTTSGDFAGIVDPAPYKSLSKKSNWISIEDALPPITVGITSDVVICAAPHTTFATVLWNDRDDVWVDGDFTYYKHDFTHWMSKKTFLSLVGAP